MKVHPFLAHIVRRAGRNVPIVLFGPMEALHHPSSLLYRYLHSPEAPTLHSVSVLALQHVLQDRGRRASILWLNMPKVSDVGLLPTGLLVPYRS